MTGKKFDVVLRGYERAQVDELVARAEKHGLTREEWAEIRLTITLRGYDPRQVDDYLSELVGGAG
ncbi:DivIVA domain-containing protein [Longispora sp. K20-0274]|uniref:DivIVA domain-containing protein n=1 Tax=Longispora sp. K20-0274 TaxID=3088255 RepID=UPI00399B59A2